MKFAEKMISFLVLAAVTVTALLVVPATSKAVAVPTTMNFQGKVVNADGTNVANGNYPFTFKIYSAGSFRWGETQSTVAVYDGVFQVNLGSTCSLTAVATCSGFSNLGIDFSTMNSLTLGITFNSDPLGEMSPRVALQSVPYAYQADNASSLGGRAASGFVQLSPVSQQSGFISIDGNGTFGGNLAVTGTFNSDTLNGTALTFGGNGAATIQPASGQALTITGHAASTFSTDIGTLTLQGGSGTVSLGSSTNLTAAAALTIASGGANPLNLDTGAGAAINLGTTNATAINLNQNTLIASGKTLTVTAGATTLTGATSGDALTVSNSTSPGNIAVFKDNTTAVVTISAGGAAIAGAITGVSTYTGSGAINTTAGTIQTASTNRIDNAGNLVNIGNFTAAAGTTFATTGANGFTFKPGTDSANAFQIQNATGWQLLNIDSTYSGLISNPGFEISSTGWANKGTGVISRVTTQNYYGVASAQIATTTPATNTGASFNVTLTASTQYTLSAYARLSTGTATTIALGRQDVSGTDAACTTSSFPTVTATGWVRLSCTFTTGGTITSSNIFVKQTDNTGRTYFVDGFKLETGATATPYRLASIAARGVYVSPVSYQNSSDSTTALQVTNAAGASLLSVDTLNNTVSIGAGVTGSILNVDLAGTATTHAVCHPGTGPSENQQLVACSTGVLGADYAELYPSQTDVEPADIVAFTDTYAPTIDGKQTAPLLAKTQNAYDHNQIGVISGADVVYNDDRAGGTQVIGYNVRQQDHPQPLALNGRVMTKVSTENGPIRSGDYITASSVPGVGMRATQIGEVVGRALDNYSAAGQGQILVFVNPFYYTPDTAKATATNNAIVAESLRSNGALIINSGGSGDVFIDSGAKTSSINIGDGNALNLNLSAVGKQTHIKGDVAVDGAALLTGGVSITATGSKGLDITAVKLNGAAFKIDNSDSSAIVDAAIQVTNSGGAGYTKVISTPNFTVSGAGEITAQSLSAKGGVLQLLDATGTSVISFDASGNGSLSGSLDVARANVSGGLTIGGDISVQGLSSFQKLATFIGKTIFRQDVQFDGHITVAKDSAGYATLRTAETTIHVAFKTEYAESPIVSAAVTNGVYVSYSIDHIDTKGFDVSLKEPASADTKFSWTAVGVNDPQTAQNPLPQTP